MKKEIGKLIFNVIVCVTILMTLMWIATWKRVSFDDAQIIYPSGAHQAVKLPFSAAYTGKFSVRLTVTNVDSAGYTLRIFPDDELIAMRLNGRSISLQQLTLEQRRAYDQGFKFYVGGFRVHAANVLEFDLVNTSNPAGFNVEPVYRLNSSQTCAIIVVLGIFGVFLSRRLRIDTVQKLCFAAGIVLCVLYLSKTDSHLRTFDVYEGGGHRDYIEYLIAHHEFPRPGDGWEYHQPPFYYLVAAVVKVTAHIPAASGELWAQVLALYFWTIFLVAGLAALRMSFSEHRTSLFLSSLAFVWWPTGIIHSIRIGNDTPLYAFYALAFCFVLRWWKQRKTNDLWWACIWMCIAVITKSSGLAIAATICVLWLLRVALSLRDERHCHRDKRRLFTEGLMISAMLVVAVAISFGANVYFYFRGVTHDWLLSNVGQTINSGLRVQNGVSNFLIFDTATYLQHPFISTWHDEEGRQYFWNFFLRSSLSSEFSFNGTTMYWWGISNGIFLLCLIASMMVYALQRPVQIGMKKFVAAMHGVLPWLLSALFSCALLVAFRIKAPYSCNADFRYVYPVLLTWVWAAGYAIKQRGVLPIPAWLAGAACLIGLNTIVWFVML